MAYVSLAELKSFLGLPDEQDDATLGIALDAACRHIDKLANRSFELSTASAKRLWARERLCLFIPDVGSTSSFVLKTDADGDGTFEVTWASTDYQLEPYADGVRPMTLITAVGTQTFPIHNSGRFGVEITAKWGWPQVPAEIKQASLILAARLWKRKDSPEGVLGFAEYGMRLGNQDKDVRALVLPFRREAFA